MYLQTKSQLKMSQAIAERQIAIQVAATRERLIWFVPMMISSTAFLAHCFKKTKASAVLFPMIPMTFAFVYQIDFAYCNKMQRIKGILNKIVLSVDKITFKITPRQNTFSYLKVWWKIITFLFSDMTNRIQLEERHLLKVPDLQWQDNNFNNQNHSSNLSKLKKLESKNSVFEKL